MSVLALLLGCGSSEPVIDCEQLSNTDSADTLTTGSNVLVIMSDDIGIDKTGVYDAHPRPALTPNIDELACAGVMFNHAYSYPVCSSSRAALMTGRHGSRTGIGRWIDARDGTHDLQLDEVTIPEMLTLSAHGYTTAAVGKWHLVTFERETDPATHPNDQGFSYYAGSLGNPLEAIQEGNDSRGYENWEKATNGVLEWMTAYMSTDTADEAIDQIATMPEPWFLYAAFNGAHAPVHLPPRDLITTPTTKFSSDRKKYDAMVEATDAEIGRVIASIPPDVLARTTIIYLTDNGTPGFAIRSPWDDMKGKGSLFQGGVNVPMIVSGPLVSETGRTSDAVVGFVDLLPTIAEISGIPLDGLDREIDGVSFLPILQDPGVASIQEVVYSEKFHPNGPPPYDYHYRMVTDGQWKLIRKEEGGAVIERLYRLDDWQDSENVLSTRDDDAEAAAAYDRLSAAMAARIAALTFAGNDKLPQ